MRRLARLFLSVLFSAALYCSPAAAQEEPTPRSVLGLAYGAGYFLYSQDVDGGYSIKGKTYDLVWSGLQLQALVDFHWQSSNHPFLGLGVAASFLLAPKATGANWDKGASVDPGQLAFGGTLAFSTCFWPRPHWRLSVLSGLASNGISGELGFGGWGPFFGGAVHVMSGGRSFAQGIGLRFNSAILFSPRDGKVRGESGGYASLLLEVLFGVGIRRSLPPPPPEPPLPEEEGS